IACRVIEQPEQRKQSKIAIQTALSNSRNAVSYTSARTMNRFPSPRCASAIQIVRPCVSIADTQPQLHPALLQLSPISSEAFPHRGFAAASLRRVFERPEPSAKDPRLDQASKALV